MKHFTYVIFLFSNIILAQHSIKGVFYPAEKYKSALLYKVTPTVSTYITNSEIKKDGSFELKLDSTATKGTYRIVYGMPQQSYNFDLIYNKKEDIILSFNAETGVVFKSSVENKLLASYTESMSAITYNISNYFKDQNNDTTILKNIFKNQRNTQTNFEKQAKGTIALHFIKANKPYIPKTFESKSVYIKNLERHFFDSIDFNNTTLQNSSFLEHRMENYVFGVSNNLLDEQSNYKNNIAVFCNAMKNAPIEVRKFLLYSLWEQMANLNQEQVANYIADTYLIALAKTLNDTNLVNILSLFKNVSIGQKAPDFLIQTKKDQTTVTKKLSDLDLAKNYIILFWSSTCSHCLDAVPKLKTFVNTLDKNQVKVIAIGLEDEPENWQSIIKNMPEFIHVYGINKWQNSIAKDYAVNGTPSYLILDKDKRILAKPYDLDALKDYFNK